MPWMQDYILIRTQISFEWLSVRFYVQNPTESISIENGILKNAWSLVLW